MASNEARRPHSLHHSIVPPRSLLQNSGHAATRLRKGERQPTFDPPKSEAGRRTLALHWEVSHALSAQREISPPRDCRAGRRTSSSL